MPSIPSIAAVTPTLCGVLGVAPPALCRAEPVEAALRSAGEAWGPAAQRSRPPKALVYLPDALGAFLHGPFPDLFARIRKHAPLQVPVLSVMPPKTPVCFASMFTGAAPESHGIRRYERPVLACDTFFDACARAGRRVAVVAVADSSMDRIFRGRSIDLYSELYDPEVTRRVLDLLEEGTHDTIVAYHQAYDDALHETDPVCGAAIAALSDHTAAFEKMARAADACWAAEDRVYLVAPDHGAHRDPSNGRGDHGEDIPEDMEVVHFYGFARGGGASR